MRRILIALMLLLAFSGVACQLEASPLPYGQFTTHPAGWTGVPCGPYGPCVPDSVKITTYIEGTPLVPETAIQVSLRVGTNTILGTLSGTVLPLPPGTPQTGIATFYFHDPASLVDWSLFPDFHHQAVDLTEVLAGCPRGCYADYSLLSGSGFGFSATHTLVWGQSPASAGFSTVAWYTDMGFPGTSEPLPEPTSALLLSGGLALMPVLRRLRVHGLVGDR